ALRGARAAGAIAIRDPAAAPAAGLDAVALFDTDILTPHGSWPEALVGLRPATRDAATEAATKVRERGARVVLVKMGAAGVVALGAGGTLRVPPVRVATVDAVGAGDWFNGGLADALARGLPFPEALRFAAACGALSTTRYGAAAAAPTRDEVETLLRST